MDGTPPAAAAPPRPALIFVLILLAISPGTHAGGRDASGPEAAAAQSARHPGDHDSALRVFLEPIAVDGRGTWSLGSETADIFPGDVGVLKKTATLLGRQERNPPREMIELTIRVTPAIRDDGNCGLHVDAETSRVITGVPLDRTVPPAQTIASVVVATEAERLLEVYSSPFTLGRLALRIRCGPRPPDATVAEAPQIDFVLSIDRAEEKEPLKLLKTNVLTSGVGREASNLFNFNVPLPEGEGGERRYRRERIEIRLAPELLSGGRLQVAVGVEGEIASVSALDPAVVHAIEYQETAVLAAGQLHSIELEVLSSGSEEGWSRLRYRISVLGRF
jgi:hypothetical protein